MKHYSALACLIATVLPIGTAESTESPLAAKNEWLTTAQDVTWKTGTDLNRALMSETQVTWRGSPLREALIGLSENQHIAIFLDRRVDPSQRVDFASGAGTVEDLFAKLCQQLQLEFAVIDSVIYIGPRGGTDRVASAAERIAEQLKSQPNNVRASWATKRALEWDRLAEPRSIILDWSSTAEIRLANLDRVEHDLWHQQSLPDLPVAIGLVLLLGGFDLTVEITPDSMQASIVELPDRVTFERDYPIPRGMSVDVEEVQEFFELAELQRRGNRIVMIGSAAEHQQLRDALAGKPVQRPANTGEQKTYTIRDTTTAAGNVIATVADQLSLTPRFEADAATRLQQRVRVDVADVSLEELLDTVLDPLGLSYEVTATEIIIRPARFP